MNDELIDNIKSRGYWRINFQPIGEPANLTLADCDELVEKNSVRLRGWSYPFYPQGITNSHGSENHQDYRQGWVDFGEYKEFWRMYKSAQFLHYSAVREDWLTSDTKNIRQNLIEIEPGKYLNFIGSLTYYITEIMEFLTRLRWSGLYANGARVIISLHNTKSRELASFDPGRQLAAPRVTQADVIVFEKIYSVIDLQGSARDLAIEPIVHFFEIFNMSPSVNELIKKDQDTLYGYNTGS